MPKSSKPRKSEPFLSLRNATFRLGDRLIFRNTSWTFHRHEQWAIIGANGSGKSLLADALRGRLPLVQGELIYHFRPSTGLSPEESIGHVSFEDRKLDLHDTVVQSRWNSIEEDGALRVRDFLSYERVMEVNPFEVTSQDATARRQFERQRARAISLLHVRSFLERTLLSLSNGESQRVQLARALCHPLRLLILDEPFTGLDAATREHFHRTLERLMGTSVRVLLITNRLEDLPSHITHLLHVGRCQVVAAGPRGKRFEMPDARNARNRVQRKRASPFKPKAVLLTDLTDRTSEDRRVSAKRPSGWFGGGGRLQSSELVRLRNVTVRYGDSIILRGLNWTVKEGESWALLGPNGSGKSTLLGLILGDHPQVYGNNIEVFGRPRGTGESIWELKQEIGWVSPELHLHFNDSASCLEVVASGFQETIGLFEPPTERQLRAARHALARFELLKFADHPLFAISTGQQRMVLLARALVKGPRLLVLDEPCQGLDRAHRKLLVSTVDTLLRSGSVTTIYVTHREDEIPPSIQKIFRLPVRV